WPGGGGAGNPVRGPPRRGTRSAPTSEPVDAARRRLFRAATATLVAAPFGLIDAAHAGAPRASAHGAAMTPSPFGPPKQIRAGDLDVGYVELGNADAEAVVVLHGWPYDIHAFPQAAPLLASAGYRGLGPDLRGFRPPRLAFDG